MDTFIFTITEDGRILETKPAAKSIGSQYDHLAQELLFVRPEGREGDDLILYIQAPGGLVYRQNLGTGNVFAITRTFTQWTGIDFQVAFIRDGEETEHSSISNLSFRESLKGSAPVPEPWPSPFQEYFTDVETTREGSTVTQRFLNESGEEKARSQFSFGGSGSYSPEEFLGNYSAESNVAASLDTAGLLKLMADGGGVSQAYVDQHDAAVQTAAEAYTDAASAVLEQAISETVKLESAATQLIDSDLALKNGHKLLLEKQNGAHGVGIFMGEYDDGQGGLYEQLEVGTESDPLCLNHSAKTADGVVVGNNILVNYKDANGVAQVDQLAYLSNVSGKTNPKNYLEQADDYYSGQSPIIIDFTSVNAEVVVSQIKTAETALADSRVIVSSANMLDITEIVDGTYTLANGCSITVETNAETGMIRVYGRAGSSISRLKITNGLDFVSGSIPAAWRAERLPYSHEQLYVSRFVQMDRITQNSPNVSILYADASTGLTLLSQDGQFAEGRTAAGKVVCAIQILLGTAPNPFDWSFYIGVRKQPQLSASNFLPNDYSTPVEVAIPDTPAYSTVNPNITLNVTKGQMLEVSQGAPWQVVLRHIGEEDARLRRAHYRSGVPDGLYTPATDISWLTTQAISALSFPDVMGLYDTLMASNSAYITRSAVGLTTGQAEIAAYTFKPLQPFATRTTQKAKLPIIAVTTGVHSDERPAFMAVYRLMEQLCNNWESDPILEYLRFNVEFRILPIVCPDMSRLNVNGVNINRNLINRWNLTDVGTNYSGTEPLSENEGKASFAFIKSVMDADFYFDVHNDYASEQTFAKVYVTGEDGFPDYVNSRISQRILDIGDAALKATYRVMKSKYPAELSSLGADGYATKTLLQLSIVTGGSQLQTARGLGIPGATLETRWIFNERSEAVTYDSDAQFLAATHFGNSVLAALRYIV